MTAIPPGRGQRGDVGRYELLMTRADAETVSCPDCGAPVRAHCVNELTGEELAGPAHPGRITAARAERESGMPATPPVLASSPRPYLTDVSVGSIEDLARVVLRERYCECWSGVDGARSFDCNEVLSGRGDHD